MLQINNFTHNHQFQSLLSIPDLTSSTIELCFKTKILGFWLTHDMKTATHVKYITIIYTVFKLHHLASFTQKPSLGRCNKGAVFTLKGWVLYDTSYLTGPTRSRGVWGKVRAGQIESSPSARPSSPQLIQPKCAQQRPHS